MANINYVTGAGGFLGSYLTKIKQFENIVAIPHKKISTFKLKSFDKLFFLSSYGNMFFQTNDHKTIQANLLDLIYILEEAVKHKFESFVYMSSSSVKLPVQSMYSRAKKAAEEILLGYMDKYNLPICIVRPTTIYGPGEQPQHLIPTILQSCFKGTEMPFVKEPAHDFVFVEDVVNGIIKLSEQSTKGIIELGTGIETSNQEVLELVQKCTGYKANVRLVESMRPYDNKHWKVNNLEVKKIGLNNYTTLKDGLKITIKDYLTNNAITGIIEQ